MGSMTKTKVAAPSFAEQLSEIKKQLKVAHESASNLHSQMEQEIKNKEAHIMSLQSEIEIINTTKRDTETFIDNISKFI